MMVSVKAKSWGVIFLVLVVTAFFVCQLPKAKLDNNNYRFVPEDDPSRVTLRLIDDNFKSTTYILIALEKKEGDVFERDFLNTMKAYIERIKEIDIVESVDSIVTSNYISGDDEYIYVESLTDSDEYIESDEEVELLKQKILDWDFYERTLISQGLKSTQIMITVNFAEDEEDIAKINSYYLNIRDTAKEMFAESAEVYASGIPIISAAINESMKQDLILLLPLVIIVVLVIMYIPVRSALAVSYVLLPVFVSIICTIGAMPLFGIKLSIISTVIPVVLVAVGNSYGLHIVMRYIDEIKETAPSGKDNAAAVINAVKEVFSGVFFAAITTIITFLAFGATKVLPIREFGLFTAFGVFVSFVTSITFLPAVLIVAGGLKYKEKKRSHDNAKIIFAKTASDFIYKHKKLILIAVAVLLIPGFLASTRLIVDNVFIEYFRKNTSLVKSDNFMRNNFGGSKVISVMLSAENSEIMLHPKTLLLLDGLNNYLKENSPYVGNIMSFTDLIKRINSCFYAENENDNYYEIPSNPDKYGKDTTEELRGIIENYLFFISEASASYANEPFEPSAIRSIIQLTTLGERDTNIVVKEINEYIKNNFPPEITVTIGGTALAESATNKLVVESVWSSMIIASIALFLIIALANRSVKLGLIALSPLFIVVVVNFAVMGIAGIKLNIGTAMIASLAMGIGIDYTIHFIEAVKRANKTALDNPLFAAYKTSGAAILADAVSTSAGFLVLLFSRFVMLAQFGSLVSLSILGSAIVGLLIVPSLLKVKRGAG